ncbi:MAG: hypothetical protein WCO02_16465 [Bacteroidota bacterium]
MHIIQMEDDDLSFFAVIGLCKTSRCRMQDTGCKEKDAGCEIQDAGCGIQDAGCGMQDAGCRMRDPKRKVSVHL